MRRAIDVGVRLLVTSSLVLGLVPTTALAEALDEVAIADEQEVIELLADDEAQPEEAVVEEATDEELPVELPEPEEQPAAEEDLAEEVTEVAQAEDPIAFEDSAETEEEPVLFPQASAIEPLELNKSVSVSYVGEVEWVWSFTAPKTGAYTFESSGSVDVYVHLFSDEELQRELAYDDDSGEGLNFKLNRWLEQGQTAFLQVKAYTFGDSDSFSIVAGEADAHDLALASFELEKSTYDVYDAPVALSYSLKDVSGKELVEGTDFVFVYQNNNGEEIERIPNEIGDYWVRFKAAQGSSYYGEGDGWEWITVKDIYNVNNLHDFGITGELYWDNGPVFLLNGSDPEVWGFGYDGETEMVEGVDYTISFSNNTAVTTEDSPAIATVTGIGKYHGVREFTYQIVDTIPIDMFNITLSVRGGSTDYWGQELEYLGNGWGIKPTVYLYLYSSNDRFEPQASDYTVSYVDAAGKAVAEPTDAGDYRVVVTGKTGGSVLGTLEIPFSIVETADISDANAYPQYDGIYKSDWTGYTIAGTKDDAQSIEWSLYKYGTALIENLDYVVSSIFDAIGNFITYTFTGMGAYEGTVRSKVYVAESDQDAFDLMATVSNDVYVGRGGIDTDVAVYIDTEGSFVRTDATLRGLTLGVDYEIGEILDSGKKTATKFEVGQDVYVTLVGLGEYEGRTSLVPAVAKSDAPLILAKDLVFESFENGSVSYAAGPPVVLLKGERPIVSLSVYNGDTCKLYEGQGFTVSTETAADGKTMEVTIASDGTNSMVAGSTKVTVGLVDKFDLTDTSISYIVYSGRNAWWGRNGEDAGSGAEFAYAGFSYVPTISILASGRVNPTYSTTLKDASGKTVSSVTGAGAYTLVATGTGDWKGAIEVPLQVSAVNSIDMDMCDITLGNARLSGGASKPSVTVRYVGHQFKEGTDYTLTYGNNTAAGSKGWVKVEAVRGGALSGVRSLGFTVESDTPSKNLSEGDYRLSIESSVKEGTYYPIDGITKFAYQINDDDVAEPQVLVIENESSGEGRALTPNTDYTVEYGNNTKAGIGYVKVTGKGAYSGSLSGNFYVANNPRISIKDATVTVAGQTYTGSALTPDPTVKLGDKTLVKGTDYDVAYTNNVAAGTATVTVTGKGSYRGTATATFSIASKALSSTSVTAIPAQAYDGTAKTPAITVTDGSTTLKQGTDYTVAYAANTNAGTATVTLTGKGNYTGSKTATFTISQKAVTVKANDASKFVNEKDPELTATVTGTVGSDTVEYTLSRKAGETAGSYAITATGKESQGNYKVTFQGGSLTIKAKSGTWKKSGSRWWYSWSDGTYAKDEFLIIDGKTYRFDKSGWMVTGWTQVDGTWYYMKSSGEMATGWQKVSGTWYWLGTDGKMVTGLQTISGDKYFFETSGAMKTGWKKLGDTWYYFKSSGAAAKGWQKVSGTWYWFDADAKMATGLQVIDGQTYYLKGSGAMVAKAWQQVGSDWYYFGASGAAVKSKWQGNYYLGADGKMLTSTVTPDGYRVGADGKWDGKGKVA